MVDIDNTVVFPHVRDFESFVHFVNWLPTRFVLCQTQPCRAASGPWLRAT